MTAAVRKDIIAVEAGESAAGAVVFWRLSGDVNTLALRVAVENKGLADALKPAYVGEETALRRALKALEADADGVSILIRSLGQRGRWAVVQEWKDGPTLCHRVVLHADLSGDQPRFTAPNGGYAGFEAYQLKVRVAFDEQLSKLSPIDVSAWLSRVIVPALDAVALRDTGGFYFVPKAKLELYHAVCEALGACSKHTVFNIPAMHSTDAADAVLAAIEEECATAIVEVETFLAENTDIQDRSRRIRQDKLHEVGSKLTRYENLFGKRLSRIGARLGAVRNQLAGISIVAEAVAQGREVEPGMRLVEMDDGPRNGAPIADLNPEPDATSNRFALLETDSTEPTSAVTPAPKAPTTPHLDAMRALAFLGDLGMVIEVAREVMAGGRMVDLSDDKPGTVEPDPEDDKPTRLVDLD